MTNKYLFHIAGSEDLEAIAYTYAYSEIDAIKVFSQLKKLPVGEFLKLYNVKLVEN